MNLEDLQQKIPDVECEFVLHSNWYYSYLNELLDALDGFYLTCVGLSLSIND